MKTDECPKFGLLQGVRVVNLTMSIAGPFACGLLADMGADVIEVESPLGRDVSRPTNKSLEGWGTQLERRNSRSVCMNVRESKGRECFYELLKTADILMDAFRGGQMAKWGMSDEELWEINPRLVIVHISGFGQTGDPSYIRRSSFDGIGQAFGCFMDMNGFPDRLPVLAFPQVSDYYSGFMACVGALAGYVNAQRTGKGESVDVAQYESMIRCEGFYVMRYLNRGVLPVREGSHSTTSAGYGTYTCKDGVSIYVLILGPGVIKAACPVLGIEYGTELFPEGLPVTAFGTPTGDALEEALERFFSEHTAEEAEEILLGAGIPCSRVYTFDIAEKDLQYQAREVFTEWGSSYGDEKIKGVNIFPKMKNFPGQIWRGMPLVGADNEDILQELGVSEEEISAMYEAGLLKKEDGPFG